jgi:hypothetical protein
MELIKVGGENSTDSGQKMRDRRCATDETTPAGAKFRGIVPSVPRLLGVFPSVTISRPIHQRLIVLQSQLAKIDEEVKVLAPGEAK